MPRPVAPPPIDTPDDLIVAPLRLIGLDSNAGAIMAAVTDALRKAGNPRSVIDAWRAEAISCDYGHLLRAAMTLHLRSHGGRLMSTTEARKDRNAENRLADAGVSVDALPSNIATAMSSVRGATLKRAVRRVLKAREARS